MNWKLWGRYVFECKAVYQNIAGLIQKIYERITCKLGEIRIKKLRVVEDNLIYSTTVS